jgi:hypothetical protein
MDEKPKGKRKREKVVQKAMKAAEEEDFENEKEEQVETMDTGKRPLKESQSKKVKPSLSGEQYKSSKGQGDGKKGKFDPFAYVPLDPKMTNKR